MTNLTQKVEVRVEALCPGCNMTMIREVVEEQARIYCHNPHCAEKGILHYPPRIRIRRYP